MQLSVSRQTAERFATASRLAAAFVTVVGLLVLVGWTLDVSLLKRVFPGFVTMKVNTALAFVLLGVALLLLSSRHITPRRALLGQSLAALTGALMVLTLWQHAFHVDFGIDQILLRDLAIPGADGGGSPGRMSIASASCFLLISMALLISDAKQDWSMWIAHLISLVALAIAGLGLIGYAYGLSPLYSLLPHRSMAIHTAACLVLLGLASLWMHPEGGLMQVFTSRRLGGIMARRLWIPVVLFTLATGGLIEVTKAHFQYSHAIGTAAFALTIIALATAVIWRNAHALNVASEGLQHRERLYAVLSECNQTILRLRRREDLLPEVCRIVCQTGGFSRACVSWVDEQSGRTEVISCYGGEARPDAAATFPVRLDDRTAGVLTVNPLKGTLLSHDDHVLLHEVASDVSYALEQLEVEARRRQAESALRETTQTLQSLIDASPLAIIVIDAYVRVKLWSPAAEHIFGWTANEVLGTTLPIVPPDGIGQIRPRLPEMQLGVDRRRRCKDGRMVDVSMWTTPLRDAEGEIIGTMAMMADITVRKKLETQVRQSQKLDALGALAGGIAHDFNNILTVLGIHVGLMRDLLPQDHDLQESVVAMEKGCGRAADLVRQILTFARKQEQIRQVVGLDGVITEAVKMLRATVPKSIDIECQFEAETDSVLADVNQVQQVVLNLGINAAQAIGNRIGVITLTLESMDVDTAVAATSPDLHLGRYVRMGISDTGCGMDRATIERIFEPFFTTKPVGQGTGLGLSVVQGIVKNHQGAVTVYSEIDKGTQFYLYFPVVEGEAPAALPSPDVPPRGRGEVVLYLDDEEALVTLTSRLLRQLGYEVVGFTRAVDALVAFRQEPNKFDIVLTDLAMPGASGFDVAAAVLEIRADIPVVLTTGFIDPEGVQQAHEMGIREVVMKPTTVPQIAAVFEKVLNRQGDGREDAELL